MKKFENIGGKIKRLAVLISTIGMILSVVIGFIVIVAGIDSGDEPLFIMGGIAVAAFGMLLSNLMAYNKYGFGELIEKTSEIADYVAKANGRKDIEE